MGFSTMTRVKAVVSSGEVTRPACWSMATQTPTSDGGTAR